MEIQRQNGTLTITGLLELSAANARSFRDAIVEFLSSDLQKIEIDLSQTQLVDSCGLGALITLFQTVTHKGGESSVSIHLLNPAPPVQQMIELTRLHHLFEVTPSAGSTQNANPDFA
jgi:anti-sigma B factor antagonist